MKSTQGDLTQGPLRQQIFWFSLPLMFSNLLQVLFNIADVAVVGQFAGSIALGSVGSTTTLVTMFTGFLMGMANGVNVLTALHYGAKSRKELSATVHSALLLCAAAGTLLLGIGVLFAEPILRLLNTKEELLPGAVLYLRVYFLGMPALGLYNFGNAVFSAVGDTKRPLRYLSISGAVNIVLNLVFVLGCNMDVAGVATASVIAQYLSAFLVVSALFRSTDIYGLRLPELHLDARRAKAILSIGVPSGVQSGIFALANLFIQMGVNSFDAVMVAANSAAANADNLVYDVMASFYTACGSFIGQNYGAKQKERMRQSYRISVTYSFCFGMGLGLFLLALGPQFLGLFTKDPAVAAMGMKRLQIMSVSYGVSAFMDCTIAASRGLGKSLAPTVIVILGSCLFRIAWIYTIFAHFRTIPSLYLLYIFSWVLTAIPEILYFRHSFRKLTAEF